MKLLAKMIALVATKFEGVLDKQGVPYFDHCYHVMKTSGVTEENHLCIALGHDLVEDTDVTLHYLHKEFNATIAGGIDLLTHYPSISYEDQIKRIANCSFDTAVTDDNVIAKIKMADLRHNMDASRLKDLTKKDFDRMEKYMRAYKYLSKT